MIMTGRGIIAVVVGIVGVLIGAALIVSAATVLTADRDADGFVITETYAFQSSSRAMVFDDVEPFADVPAGLAGWIAEPTDIRLRGARADGGSLFMGIAASADLGRYLTAVAYDEVTGVEFDASSITDVESRLHDGVIGPMTAGTKDIWVAWTEGNGPQTIDWAVESGEWSILVMNSDRSAGLEVGLALGAQNSNTLVLTWLAIAAGLLFVVGGGYLAYRGVRPPTEPERVVDLREEAPPVEAPPVKKEAAPTG
jgi:hypothetical protein